MKKQHIKHIQVFTAVREKTAHQTHPGIYSSTWKNSTSNISRYLQQYVKKQHIKHIQVFTAVREKTAHQTHPGIYSSNIFSFFTLQHPDRANINLPWPQKKFVGYYKIARHYKWALNQVFKVFNYSTVLIVEGEFQSFKYEILQVLRGRDILYIYICVSVCMYIYMSLCVCSYIYNLFVFALQTTLTSRPTSTSTSRPWYIVYICVCVCVTIYITCLNLRSRRPWPLARLLRVLRGRAPPAALRPAAVVRVGLERQRQERHGVLRLG